MVSKMMVVAMTVAAVLACLLCGVTAVVSSVDTCQASFSGSYVVLCHHQPGNDPTGGIESCPNKGQGLVLTDLVIAPRQQYKDCSAFHNTVLYNVSCLGRLTQQPEEYDRIVFDILNKVSGRNSIDSSSMLVDRFPISDDVFQGVHNAEESDNSSQTSAFVVFKKQCKPAFPEHFTEDPIMIRMCSNETISGDARMYLTLHGTEDIPQTPSMCRCVIRPTKQARLLALDVRLQDRVSRQCGQTDLKIETKGSSRDIHCDGMSALYGSLPLYGSGQEMEITLNSVSADSFPSALWLEVQDKWIKGADPLTVSCEGFIPMDTDVTDHTPDPDDDGDGDGDGDEDGDGVHREGEQETAQAGKDFVIILVAVLVGIASVVFIVIFIIFLIKRRRSGSLSVLPSPCGRCCRRESDGNLSTTYKCVPQVEPVYAEPGNPRPSTSTPPYTFPADAMLPQPRPLYSEPDPEGTLGLSDLSAPPPLPDCPPPGSPPPGVFPPGTPPPKPERTLLRPGKGSVKNTVEDESYDHILTGERHRLKSSTSRDGQNNIVREEGNADDVCPDTQTYSHLEQSNDYSHVGFTPKQTVKDNVYNTST